MISLLHIYEQVVGSNVTLKRLETKMSALTDAIMTLTTNVDKLSSAVAANDTAIQDEIAALKTALTAGNPAEVAVAIANISALSTAVGMQADAVAKETANLKASLPPA